MRSTSARIPAEQPPYTAEVAEQLRRAMPPGVEPIALFRTFARNPEMMGAMHGWGAYELSRRLSVDLRSREIVIDRTCARCHCEYEWAVHVAYFADKARLSTEQIASLTHGTPADDCWTADADRLLVSMVDELHDTSDVGDELWSQLARHFTEPQLLDLLLLCGWYHAVSYAGRAARVPHEPGTPRFADLLPNAPLTG